MNWISDRVRARIDSSMLAIILVLILLYMFAFGLEKAIELVLCIDKVLNATNTTLNRMNTTVLI